MISGSRGSPEDQLGPECFRVPRHQLGRMAENQEARSRLSALGSKLGPDTTLFHPQSLTHLAILVAMKKWTVHQNFLPVDYAQD